MSFGSCLVLRLVVRTLVAACRAFVYARLALAALGGALILRDSFAALTLAQAVFVPAGQKAPAASATTQKSSIQLSTGRDSDPGKKKSNSKNLHFEPKFLFLSL